MSCSLGRWAGSGGGGTIGIRVDTDAGECSRKVIDAGRGYTCIDFEAQEDFKTAKALK